MLRSMTAVRAYPQAESPRRAIPQHGLAPLGRRRRARAIPNSLSSSCSDSSRSFRLPPAQVPHHRWETPRTRRVTVPRSKIGGNRNCRAQMTRRLQAIMSTGFSTTRGCLGALILLGTKSPRVFRCKFCHLKTIPKNTSSQILDLHKNSVSSLSARTNHGEVLTT